MLPLVIVGLTTGSVYAIAAMGLVLTYKTSGVFNFAHGAQAAVAAYLMYTFRDSMGLHWLVAAVLAVALAGVVGGLVLERLALALAGSPTSARVVASVGLLIGIQGVLIVSYGAAAISFDPYLPTGRVQLPGINVSVSQMITVTVGVALAAGLYAFFRRSQLGVAMQAVVDDPELLGLQGTSPLKIRRYSWVIGSVFTAVSGVLLAPVLGLEPTLLTLLVVQAFGAAAIGAFDSLLWTYLGALGLGIAAAVLPSYLPEALVGLSGQAVLPFLVLFGALLVMPRTRLVQRGERAMRPQRPLRQLSRPVQHVGLAFGALLLVAVPLFVGASIGLYTKALAFAILVASLALLVRTSGQVSLCHVAFAGVGAAVFARAAAAGVPWPVAVLFGGMAAIPVGAAVAVPAIRLSGVYLAIATFGFGILVERVAFPASLLFGSTGALHAPRPRLAFLPFDSDVGYYYLVLGVTVACLAVIAAVRRGRLGRLLQGLADSPSALAAHGTDTNLTRLFVFTLSAFLAGIGGAVIGPITGSASPASFGFMTSLLLLAVLAIARRRHLVAPFIAAFLLVIGPSFAAWLVPSSVLNDQTVAELLPVAFGIQAIAASIERHRTSSRGLRWRSKRSRERAGSPWLRHRRPVEVRAS